MTHARGRCTGARRLVQLRSWVCIGQGGGGARDTNLKYVIFAANGGTRKAQ